MSDAVQDMFERWGALVARYPSAVLSFALVLLAISAVGVSRIHVDPGPQQVFANNSDTYARYQAMRALFPPSQMDAVLVISDPALLTPDRLDALRSLHLDLSLEDNVVGVISLFSAPRLHADGGATEALVPNEIPRGDAFDTLRAEIIAHPLLRNRLVSGDESTVLFTVSLDPDHADLDELVASTSRLRDVASAILAPHDLTAVLTGTPAIQAESYVLAERERLWLNLVGFLLGITICYLYFRRWSFALLAAAAPFASIAMTFGAIGWAGAPLTLTLQIVAPLVIIIAFNNAMHMLFAILSHGADRDHDPAVMARAVGQVGPATLMTSLTSAVAFSALMLTRSDAIREFGALAAFGTVTAFVSVVTIIPALVVLVRRLRRGAGGGTRCSERGALAAVCAKLDAVAAPRSGALVAIGCVAIATALASHGFLVPNYQLRDNVPTTSETAAALSAIDQAFGGSQPMRILVRWPAGEATAEADVLGVLDALETRIASLPDVGSVLSLATVAAWLRETGQGAGQDLDTLIENIPHAMRGGMIERGAGAALMTAVVPDQTTELNRALVMRVGDILADAAQRSPGFTFEVTGSVALTALETDRIISSLQISLLTAIAVIIGLIGVAFHSLRNAAISVLPNIFPIAVGGAYLFLSGGNLNFSGAIALTVAFGLAVDDTIHMLYRFRREARSGNSPEVALQRTVAGIGQVLVFSTLVLIAGLSVLLFSPMPMNQEFARLTAIVLLAALAGDLVLLPAIIRVTVGKRAQ
jgi:predicted RND superfamily exporter protein